MQRYCLNVLAVTGGMVFGLANAGTYQFTTLNGPEDLGFIYTAANAINDAGQVAGYGYYAGIIQQAYIWNSATPTALGGTVRVSNTAYAINSSGQTVGTSGFVAVSWIGDTTTVLGGIGSSANAINGAGQIVGIADGQAVIWSGTSMTKLGTLGGPNSQARAINNAGQIAGQADLITSYTNGVAVVEEHATVWNGSVATDLGTLGGTTSWANGINDFGQVVGAAFTASGRYHATAWSGTTATDLGTLGGPTSWANSINDKGQIVGYFGTGTSSGNHAFIASLSDGSMIDLNSLLPASAKSAGWELSEATDINNEGQIVGAAINRLTGQSPTAFVMTPVPEPQTYAMAIAGLGLLGIAARRRKYA